MVSPKGKKAGKGGKGGPALAVVSIALDVLDSPAVREFLQNVPSQVFLWAKHRRSELHIGVEKKVTDRFGQKGLEHRLAAVRDTFNTAFGAPDAPGRAEVVHALDSLQAALEVAGPLPFLKRKRAHFAIDNELDRLERQLIKVVLGRLEQGSPDPRG
jgi:hypothetical protein